MSHNFKQSVTSTLGLIAIGASMLAARAAFGSTMALMLNPSNEYMFPGISGPQFHSTVLPARPTLWQQYAQGSDSTLAVYLTDPDSDWLSFAHGLRSIGIPFVITTNYHDAIKHKVIYVYPELSDAHLSSDALDALKAYPLNGGTLIAQNVLADGFESTFGFAAALPNTNASEVRFSQSQALTSDLHDPFELMIPIAKPKSEVFGMYEYTKSDQAPIATYSNGQAAITSNKSGSAYAIGIDIGYVLFLGYGNRQEGIARSYVNKYEPTIDVLLNLVKNMYIHGQQNAVTLGTVPDGKKVPVLLTHDIDYTRSLVNALTYAQYERQHGITTTYFMQVKYIKDWNDDMFFTKDGVNLLLQLQSYGMEIASHSIAHSRQFRYFPMGSGNESYPAYHPFVVNAKSTLHGSILGELRVSKFLLEHFLPNLNVVSFRPGHLSNPYSLPQALQATGYRYSSSVTANDSLTQLPFQLNYDRYIAAEVPVYEFPLTIEDEADAPMLHRLPQALELVKKLERYGGLCNILIHPNVVGQKFDFEKGFISGVGPDAWYGSVEQFGDWWAARDQVQVSTEQTATGMDILIHAPKPIAGLTLNIPDNMMYQSSGSLHVLQNKTQLVIMDRIDGDVTIKMSPPKAKL